jgi:hypothetical protein
MVKSLAFKDRFIRRAKPKAAPAEAPVAVQTAPKTLESLQDLSGFGVPIAPDGALYAEMRKAVPVIDAALDKIVRLTGGFRVISSRRELQGELDRFVSNVPVGAGAFGLDQFMDVYLDSLLTYGNAVGEMVLDGDGREIRALYNAGLGDIRVRQGATPLDLEIAARGDSLTFTPVPQPELILFTPLNPPAGSVLGEPLLRSLPFVSSVLMKIFSSISVNFERIANLRYAVTYKPGSGAGDKAWAKDVASSIAREWSDAMSATATGAVKDFVAVGDVDIKVIGADNQMIDTEVPVRQMLEQIVAKLGIPPFMLGLHWSTTERMSTQQADILTSELWSYRKILDSVIERIGNLWMRLHGYGATVSVVWDEINLQDELESARARLLSAQAEQFNQEGGKPTEN